MQLSGKQNKNSVLTIISVQIMEMCVHICTHVFQATPHIIQILYHGSNVDLLFCIDWPI